MEGQRFLHDPWSILDHSLHYISENNCKIMRGTGINKVYPMQYIVVNLRPPQGEKKEISHM